MGDGLGWWRPRNALWLLVLIGSGLTCPARVPGASVSGLSVSDTRGREIMAVVRESGRAAVTEVWVRRSGADDRYLGSIPGTADALCWSADGSLLIRLRPLALPMMGLTVMPVRDWRLCDDAVWQIDPERGRARRGESTVAFGPAQPVGRLPLRAQADRQMELRLVDAALNLASAGYSFMQSWDFKAAERRYKSAAKAFGDLLDGSGGVHFLEMPVKAYREAIQSMARTADRAAPRWVCREHLQTIGDLLKAYGADRDGARPPSLAALRDWLESLGTSADDAKLMGRLFRPYRDWEPGRTLAYYYLPEAEDGSAVLTSFFHKGYLVELVGAGPDYRVSDRRIGRVHVDSLMNVGRYHYDTQSDSSEAIAVYEVVTGIVPDFAEGHCQLGYAHLKVGNLRRALRAFERAVACDDRLPEAYLGLGLLFRRWPRGDYDAIRYFQKALQFRRDYVEARYNIAEIRFKLEELDAKKDIDKVLAINPQYAPAYLLMGRYFEVLRKEYDTAALYYAQHLSLRPGSREARVRLGRVYLRIRSYDRVLGLLEAHIRAHPDDYELLPILAQACAKLEAQDRSEAYYDRYLKEIKGGERYNYEDVSLLASPAELDSFSHVIGTDREEAFLGLFWASRDPDLTTAANERRLEHYRRVWYARQNFAKVADPWDRRGEVYVRFGEPEHRSQSNDVDMDQSLEVQHVKEGLARTLYGDRSAPGMMMQAGAGYYSQISDQVILGNQSLMTSNFAGPVFPVRSMGVDVSRDPGFTAQVTDSEAGVIDAPSTGGMPGLDLSSVPGTPGARYGSGTTSSSVPWESWVYTDIGGGIEIVFTDEWGRGFFDYAPVPDAGLPLRQLARLNQFSPRNVTSKAITSSPDHYQTLENKNPLGYYYDVASFRSPEPGATLVDVYLAVPYSMARYVEERRETWLDVTRSVALLNEETGAVIRRKGRLRFSAEGDLTSQTAGFVPDVVQLEVPPGTYRMEISARDSYLKRRARYRQQVVVPAYPSDTLGVSDLALAWRISEEAGEGDTFRKGDLRVVPMPTRTYGLNEAVHVYYEIYNLTRNPFGRTNYRVSYSVIPRESGSPAGLIRRLARLGRGGREMVAVTSDRQGDSSFEREYVALNLGHARAGEVVLKVVVADLNAASGTERQATFVMAR